MGVQSIPGGGGGGGKGAALHELAGAIDVLVLGAGGSANQPERLPNSLLDLPCHTEWKHQKYLNSALLALHPQAPQHPTCATVVSCLEELHPPTLSEYDH